MTIAMLEQSMDYKEFRMWNAYYLHQINQSQSSNEPHELTPEEQDAQLERFRPKKKQ
jgi:hypothetical protein